MAADRCVRESYSLPGFSGSEDCVAMEQLLQGYDEQDEEQVSRVCTSPLLRYMDNDVSLPACISLMCHAVNSVTCTASSLETDTGMHQIQY